MSGKGNIPAALMSYSRACSMLLPRILVTLSCSISRTSNRSAYPYLQWYPVSNASMPLDWANAVKIPHTALAKDALRDLVEEFVAREGTDYGDRAYTLEDKVRQVMRQLEEGSAVILYDSRTETCHIEN